MEGFLVSTRWVDRGSNRTFMIQELRVEGFLVSTRWADRWQEGIQAMATWIQASQLLLVIYFYKNALGFLVLAAISIQSEDLSMLFYL